VDRAHSVAALLDPTHQVVPFHGREPELHALTHWRDSPVPQASLLLHAPAGAGKTRLLQHFQEQWDPEGGRLLVIDDADRLTWNDIFLQLQDTLRHGPARTRVLLAARTTGWWWSSTRQRIADFDHEVTDLPLAPTLDDRAGSFTLACQHFAKQLNVTAPDEPPPNIAGETVLDLHMAALTAVHGDPCDVNRTQLVRQLLQRDDGPATGRIAEDYLAVATPDTPDPDLLARAAQRWPHLHAKLDEIIDANPAIVGDLARDSLRIAAGIGAQKTVDHLARQVFRDERFATDSVPATLTQRLVDRARDTLERAETYGMLSARTALCGLREEAVEASRQEVECYRELAEQDRENRPLLADALGDLGLRLLAVHRADEVLKVSEEAIALWHEIAIDDPETIPQLASALEQISYRYQAMGLAEASMDAISRATLMYQELAKTHPALFRVDFARVAATVARRFHTQGEAAEAADSMQLSIANWRVLAQEDPRYEPDFARNLVAAGTMLVELRRAEAAGETLKEAVEVFRRLAVVNPQTFGSELADALMRYSQALRDLCEDPDAKLTAQEAVMLWRETGDRRGLGTALLNVVKVAFDYDAELGAAQEAVEVYRELAAENTVWHQVDLAIALATLTEQQLIGDQADEALRSADEVFGIVRRLPSQLIDFFGAKLAVAMQPMTTALSELEHHELALESSELMLDIWRALKDRTPSATGAYIGAVQQHACKLRGAQRRPEARDTAHTAVVLWHMTGKDLDREPGYADTLTVYGRLCAETKYELDKALQLTHQAVRIMREGGDAAKLEFALETVEAIIDAFDDRLEAEKAEKALSWS
jgi:tetratricopeptide (TPR) repeat protein